jgi:transcription antitermination factor NusG
MFGFECGKWAPVAHRAELHTTGRKMLVSTNIGDAVEQAAWWAVYTQHQHEKTVAEMLTGKGFEVFLPLHDSMRRWKDRQKLLSLPLFPGYVFVRGLLSRRLQVVTTPGIHMILSRGEQIEVVPEAEIDAVRRAVQGSYKIEPHPFLKIGERVRVTRGSLEGVEGILVRKKNLYRLVLSVDMLAQSVGVEVSAADVEPVGGLSPKSAPSTAADTGIGNFQKNFPSAVANYDARLDSTR